MPIYEYYCPNCHKEFEIMCSISKFGEVALCPICGAKGERLISNVASREIPSKTARYIKSLAKVRVPAKQPFRQKAEPETPSNEG